MKKIIREIDKKRGIVQVTVADSRWYLKPSRDEVTGLPTYAPVPSVTWVAGYWPKGIGFYRWLAEKGWDEAEAVKASAGERGSAVHLALEMILNGEEFRVNTKIQDKSKSDEKNFAERELTYEELVCVQSFMDWYQETGPETIATETVIFSDIHGYAGTVDYICRIDGVPWVIDFKTSPNLWREYDMQVSAYRVALENGENPLEQNGKPVDLGGLRAGILQVGYPRNSRGYKFTPVDDSFHLFKVAQQIWKAENGENKPGFTKRDFPLVISEGKKEGPKLADLGVMPETDTTVEPTPRKKKTKSMI